LYVISKGYKRLKGVLRRFSFILLILPLGLQAQITAPGSNATRHTHYPATSRIDSVYVFCSSSSSLGALTANSPGGTAPFTFAWTRYDTGTSSYSIAVKTENGTTSTASSLAEGGYRVHITDGFGYSTYLYAWVNLDNPTVNAALKNRTCSYVALDGTIALDNFYYNDPSTGASVKLPDGIAFLWSSDPSSTIPANVLDPIISIPPLVNETYMLQVTDSFGCANSSSFFYESIHVDANFDAKPSSGEAPLEVTFTNNSVRANTYVWNFGDDSISYLADPPSHTYYTPGTYIVTLDIESTLFCTDTYSVTITVDPSALGMPNVFSPNGDGINDFFVPEKVSLRYVEIQIYSKGGQRVYHYEGEGESLSAWNGWDGNINNSSRLAEPGVYFYVIKAKGWDDKKYNGAGYRGILYLYR
jgi:gliding motility-associated-like protein